MSQEKSPSHATIKKCRICGNEVKDEDFKSMNYASFCCGYGMSLIKKPSEVKKC